MQGKTHRYGGLALGAVASLATVNSIEGVGTFIYMGTFLAGAGLGSLIPDLDHQHSELSKKIKPLGMVVSSAFKHRGFTHTGLAWFMVTLLCLATYFGLNSVEIDTYDWGSSFIVSIMFTSIMVSLFLAVSKIICNRIIYKIKNSIVNMLGLLVILLIANSLFADVLIKYAGYYFIGISIGYLSHLLVDMLTVSGVPLMYPYTNKMYRVAKLTTGEDDKWVGRIFFAIFILFLFIRLFL